MKQYLSFATKNILRLASFNRGAESAPQAQGGYRAGEIAIEEVYKKNIRFSSSPLAKDTINYLRWQSFPTGKRLPNHSLLLVCYSISPLERFPIEVLSTKTRLPPKR